MALQECGFHKCFCSFSPLSTPFSNCRIPNLFLQSTVLSENLVVLFFFPSRKTGYDRARTNALPLCRIHFQICTLLRFFPLKYRPLSLLKCCSFPGGSIVKKPPAKQEVLVQFLGWEDPWEKEMGTHSSILAWKIPRTEVPGRIQSMGSQKSWIWLSD